MLWLSLPVLALTKQQKADAIIQASPAAQQLIKYIKPNHGELSIYVDGLTGKMGPDITEKDRNKQSFTPGIWDYKFTYYGTTRAHRVIALLDKEGRIIHFIAERDTIIPVKVIPSLSTVNHLMLKWSQVEGAVLDMSQFNNLETITLTLNGLQNIKLPKSGKLIRAQVEEEDTINIDGLSDHKNLDSLILYTGKVKDLSGLNNNPNLEYLLVAYTERDGKDTGLKIETFNNLKTLIASTPSYHDIDDLYKLENLTKLRLFSIKGKEMQGLKFPPNIEDLSLLYPDGENFPNIKGLHQLKRLFVKNTDGNFITKLSDLPNLIKLEGNNNNLPNLEGIESIPSLKEIDCQYCKVVDISAVRKLPNLENLYLYDNEVYDIAPALLAPKLKSLLLPDNKVIEVPNLPIGSHLNQLNLSGNPLLHIDDETIKTYENVEFSIFRTHFYKILPRKKQLLF
ncbi:hypothetical protein VAZ01S_015_00090 [Vibrio azureus NBRC 104587]|uniref:Uncharacterized protein n=2 Tax=Vibrio azureus TaxID=512649 RepID=U3ALW3_9VIBR|nr:hypothetical protein VAZ01S_015_00090 [Vibrio azureus NBRC 104587]